MTRIPSTHNRDTMTELLRACIESGQVDAKQIEAHRAAGELSTPIKEAAGRSLPERLRDMAKYTGLDGLRELLVEAAVALERRGA